MLHISIVTTVDNEASLIHEFVAAFSRAALSDHFACELLIVDDFGVLSLERGRRLEGLCQGVRIVRPQLPRGQLRALLYGMTLALGEVVVTMDPDMAVNIPDIKKLVLHYQRGMDVIYARRVVRADTIFLRLFFSGAFNFLVRTISGIPVRDINTPMVLLSRPAVSYVISLPIDCNAHKLHLMRHFHATFSGLDIIVANTVIKNNSSYSYRALAVMFYEQILAAWKFRHRIKDHNND